MHSQGCIGPGCCDGPSELLAVLIPFYCSGSRSWVSSFQPYYYMLLSCTPLAGVWASESTPKPDHPFKNSIKVAVLKEAEGNIQKVQF